MNTPVRAVELRIGLNAAVATIARFAADGSVPAASLGGEP